MRVRFEIDVERAAARLVAGLFESAALQRASRRRRYKRLCPRCCLRIDNDRTDVGIGRGQSDALARQVERAAQKLLVSGSGRAF